MDPWGKVAELWHDDQHVAYQACCGYHHVIAEMLSFWKVRRAQLCNSYLAVFTVLQLLPWQLHQGNAHAFESPAGHDLFLELCSPAVLSARANKCSAMRVHACKHGPWCALFVSPQPAKRLLLVLPQISLGIIVTAIISTCADSYTSDDQFTTNIILDIKQDSEHLS